MVLLQVIAPQQFITIPWKNGLGETTELAINDGGTLENFDWRLSIASVINEGFFSDFSGYQRHLVLIAGQGLTLLHGSKDESKDESKGGNKSSDNLTNLLAIATFDGACKTYGKLTAGAIKDFNIITNKQKITSHVSCYVDAEQVTVNLAKSGVYFAYSLTNVMSVERKGQENTLVPQGALLKISFVDEVHHIAKAKVKINGQNMILVELIPTETDLL